MSGFVSKNFDFKTKHSSLEFNARLVPRIAQAEIYLRNIVGFCMQINTNNFAWIVGESYLNTEIDKINRRARRDKQLKKT